MTVQIYNLAHHVLEDNPDPAVWVRLLRDVFKRPAIDPELLDAQNRLNSSKWVQMLAKEQHADGSWGRFHSRDTSVKQKIQTTEQGVWRALALGLDRAHPILAQAADHCRSLLKGTVSFPDPAEKNNRWDTGWRLFVAAILAQLQPDDPVLTPEFDLWREITQRVFADGTYSREAETLAHQALTGATVAGSYLELRNRYTLMLLAQADLPPQIEASLLQWIWTLPDGIGYFGVRLNCDAIPASPGKCEAWFRSLESLFKFPAWSQLRHQVEPLLWSHLNDNRRFDFGQRSATSTVLPLSDDWRRSYTREHDWTTRVLVLMAHKTQHEDVR